MTVISNTFVMDTTGDKYKDLVDSGCFFYKGVMYMKTVSDNNGDFVDLDLQSFTISTCLDPDTVILPVDNVHIEVTERG